jgi:hypothetical protein
MRFLSSRLWYAVLVLLFMDATGLCMEKQAFLELLDAFQSKTRDMTLNVSAQEVMYDSKIGRAHV